MDTLSDLSNTQIKRSKANNSDNYVPIWNKYLLNIREAAQYFNIGEHKLRQLISVNPNADYLIDVGKYKKIKRPQFEKYLDGISVI